MLWYYIVYWILVGKKLRQHTIRIYFEIAKHSSYNLLLEQSGVRSEQQQLSLGPVLCLYGSLTQGAIWFITMIIIEVEPPFSNEMNTVLRVFITWFQTATLVLKNKIIHIIRPALLNILSLIGLFLVKQYLSKKRETIVYKFIFSHPFFMIKLILLIN